MPRGSLLYDLAVGNSQSSCSNGERAPLPYQRPHARLLAFPNVPEIENIVNLAALQSVRKAIQTKQTNAKMTGAELIEFTQKQND